MIVLEVLHNFGRLYSVITSYISNLQKSLIIKLNINIFWKNINIKKLNSKIPKNEKMCKNNFYNI